MNLIVIVGQVVFCLAAAVFFSLPASALPRQVTVDLFQAHKPIKRLIISGPLEILQPRRFYLPVGLYELSCERKRICLWRANNLMRIGHQEIVAAEQIVLQGSSGLIDMQIGGLGRRSYRGILIINVGMPAKGEGEISVRNRLDTKDYVKAVIGSETNPDFPLEELKAQVVLAQTLIARYKKGDSLADSTDKQAYLGATYERPAGIKAVEEVWGQILVYKELPATIYFHSTCAGGTSNGERYFHLQSGAFPYLAGRRCDFCKRSPFWRTTTTTMSAQRFSGALGPWPVIDSLDERLRPLQIKSGEQIVSGYEYWLKIGQKLGWDKVPGTRYALSRQRGGMVQFSSTGAGHGIGLCQWGAAEQARRGKGYQEILQYYFPGTHIQKTR